ncbi:MAG: NAD(P)H-dependent oxidoreductase [Desulfobacterales bacterium]
MKIAIINGSPKGKKSTTLQLVQVVQNKFGAYEYAELPVGASIKALEKDSAKMDAAIDELKKADVLIWSFPVYVMVVPSQLMRFIELIQMHAPKDLLKGKYATSISTSLNFFDHTAHTYMREVSEDFGLRYFEGFSASAMEMEKEELQRNLASFFGEFFQMSEKRVPVERLSFTISYGSFVYNPKKTIETPKKGSKNILVLTNAGSDDTNLNRMIDVFVKSTTNKARVVDLNALGIKGGCLGCGECMATAVCVYKDDFMSFFNETVKPADSIIYAAAIKNRYISSIWKQYFDRNFVNGHRPILNGKPMGFLFGGPLRQLPNLREIFTAHMEVGKNPFIGFQTDECGDTEELTREIRAFSEKVDRILEKPWIRPATFLGVGGHKIFRDLVYSMRTLMVEDHKYYTEKGLYDFPE